MRKKPDDEQVGFLMEILRNNVTAIVEHEDIVKVIYVAELKHYHYIDFVVHVHHEDMGLVLGERGATADAIRRIVWTACKKTDLRVGIRFTV